MKIAIFGLLMTIGLTAYAAEPCFHPGTYRGKGFYEINGKMEPYESVTVITSDSEGRVDYTWEGGSEGYDFRADAGVLYSQGVAMGSIKCGRSVQVVHWDVTAKGQSFQIDEEWLFVGNYLLRNGVKTDANGKHEYQELMLRQ